MSGTCAAVAIDAGRCMIEVTGCNGVHCNANDISQDCAWCVYDMDACEEKLGDICHQPAPTCIPPYHHPDPTTLPVPDPGTLLCGMTSYVNSMDGTCAKIGAGERLSRLLLQCEWHEWRLCVVCV